MKIVVIGGSGLIGSRLVAILRSRGHEVLAAAPDSGVNTITAIFAPAATFVHAQWHACGSDDQTPAAS